MYTTDPAEALRLAERFAALNGHAPRPGPKLISLAAVTPRDVTWLWLHRIPIGKLTVIAGDPGLGKSFVTLDIAARLTRGRPFPDAATTPVSPGGVILISAEDDIEDTIYPRLTALRADMTRIVALEGITEIDTETGEPFERCFTIQDILRLDEAIEATPECRLVVIDPISAFLGRDVDSHRDADVRSILRPLADLAQRRHVAILIVAHHSKGAGKAVYRTMGSLAFNAAARSVLAVVKDPDDPTRRLLIPVKNNLAPDAVGLSYTLVSDLPGAHPFVRWDPTPVTATADELMGGGDADRASALAEARAWLEHALADGPVRAKDLLAAADDENISKRTLTRAKSDMNVRSVKKVDGWYWELQERQECQTPDVAPLASLAPEQLFNESEAVDSAAEGASDAQA